MLRLCCLHGAGGERWCSTCAFGIPGIPYVGRKASCRQLKEQARHAVYYCARPGQRRSPSLFNSGVRPPALLKTWAQQLPDLVGLPWRRVGFPRNHDLPHGETLLWVFLRLVVTSLGQHFSALETTTPSLSNSGLMA